ncbi:MAG: transposon-encoded TnpW family protein [Oscillospiraceae bacterium]|nr:transposon-encoded TnpW family protein [Oscillospiraceae bacterium]
MKDNNYPTTEPITIRKRIGSTIYEVRSYFNPAAKETVEEKLLRIIRNDLTNGVNRAIMKLSQTERLPERGSA